MNVKRPRDLKFCKSANALRLVQEKFFDLSARFMLKSLPCSIEQFLKLLKAFNESF
jgi:hypothetical protein